MSASRIGLSALIAVGIFIGWHYWMSTERHSEPPPSTEVPSSQTSTPATPSSTQANSHALRSSSRALPASGAISDRTLPLSGAEKSKAAANSIPFEVIDGVAIAFGDVIIGKVSPEFTEKRGHFEASPIQLWDRPQIPYVINPELPQPRRVEMAIEFMNRHTAVSFVPYTDQPDAVIFESGAENCKSALGKQGGLQPIQLAPGCQMNEILHEIMHALGFIHEQSRLDRDQFVEVLWDHIDPSFHPQFAMASELWMEPLRGAGFDYQSIMLYEPRAFARSPGLFSLRSKTSGVIAPSQNGLSPGDIQRIARVYGVHDGG